MWILAWGAEHLPRLLIGAISWSEFWNANIFHPDPLALALSEHLFGQTLQILPVYWLTGNIILCYNLLFISIVRAVGVRHLPAGARSDRRHARRVHRRARLRIPALSHRLGAAPSGDELAVDAVCVVGAEPIHHIDPGSRIAGPGLACPRFRNRRARACRTGRAATTCLYFAPFVPLFVLHRMWTAGHPTHRYAPGPC